MTDLVLLAAPKLFDDVVARFAEKAAEFVPPRTPVPQVFGADELAKHPTAAAAEPLGIARRIVWIPGDDSNGDVGELGAAREPGRTPRPIATLHELFTVYLEAVDLAGATAADKAAQAESRRAQYVACRALFNAWWGACYRAARGTVAVVRIGWVTGKTVRPHGTSLRIVIAIDSMIADDIGRAVAADVEAVWTIEELDLVEPGDGPPP